MMGWAYFLHFLATGIALFVAALGVGIGQGIVGGFAARAFPRQSLGVDQSFTAMIIGLAITETGCVFGLIIAFMLLMGFTPATFTLGAGLAELGMALVIGLPAAVVGVASGLVLKATCETIMRQPFHARSSMTLMLIALSFIEAPAIFGFIISLLIQVSYTNNISVYEGIRFLCAGSVFAFGALGAVIGQSLFTHSALRSLGAAPASYERIFTYMLIAVSIIETPVIFCLVMSFLYLYTPLTLGATVFGICGLAASTCALGLGAIGAGIANGHTASKGVYEIALDVRRYGQILQTSMVTLAIIESCAIYAFIISLLLLSRVW